MQGIRISKVKVYKYANYAKYHWHVIVLYYSETLSKDLKWMFEFVNDKISSVSGDEYIHNAYFSPCKLKHKVGVFAQNLIVSGWPQAAYQSQRAHWRR